MTHDQHDPAVHYDRITRAWGLLLGDELHWGVFTSGEETLPEATGRLTTLMIEAADLTPGLRVLDVGCGSGAPARRLALDHDVEVVGITTSEVGVRTAREASGEVAQVSFEQRDGTANGFPDDSFDRAWALESSHLMPDRQALMSECARVIRPGGRVVLCDLIRRREIPFAELRDRRREFAVLRAAFGAARMDSLEQYRGYCETAGLQVERLDDLTEQTLPTLDRWRGTAARHHDEVVELLGRQGLEEFVESLDILEAFWRDGTLGYGLLAARKPA